MCVPMPQSKNGGRRSSSKKGLSKKRGYHNIVQIGSGSIEDYNTGLWIAWARELHVPLVFHLVDQPSALIVWLDSNVSKTLYEVQLVHFADEPSQRAKSGIKCHASTLTRNHRHCFSLLNTLQAEAKLAQRLMRFLQAPLN